MTDSSRDNVLGSLSHERMVLNSDCTSLKGLMPKVYSPTACAHITNIYTQSFGNSFSFYNTIWVKKKKI